jgi:predicted nucleotidyltransferase
MKLTDTDIQQIADRAREVLQSVPGLRLAFLYGSAAAGRLRGDSDVDVAVLLDRPLDADEKMKLMACLESGLSRPVDLVDLFTLNGAILKQILCKGRVLVKKQSEDLAALLQRMTYNQADMMPYVYRTLNERQERFVHG